MKQAKAIKLNAGDDETIRFLIQAESLENDVSQYIGFWELRKTMDAEPELSKSSHYSVPSGVDFINDFTNREVMVIFSGDAQDYMTENPTFYDNLITEFINTLFPILGEPVDITLPSENNFRLTGTNGIVDIELTMANSVAISQIVFNYSTTLDTLISQLLIQVQQVVANYVDDAMGITPVYGDIFINTATREVNVFLDEEDTTPLYGQYLQYFYVRHKLTLKKTSLMFGPIIFMEGFDAEYPDCYYCKPEDVADQLQLLNFDGSRMILTETTMPTRSMVIKFIKEAEADIDAICKDSWQPQRVVSEYYDMKEPLSGMPLKKRSISLYNNHIFPIDPTKGDSIKFWTGNTFTDYALKPSVRDNTWSMDYNMGMLHLYDLWPWMLTGTERIEMTYRYGNKPIPADIKQACTMIVGMRLLQSEFNKLFITNQKANVDWPTVIEAWDEKVKGILRNHTRTIFAATKR